MSLRQHVATAATNGPFRAVVAYEPFQTEPPYPRSLWWERLACGHRGEARQRYEGDPEDGPEVHARRAKRRCEECAR